MDDKIFLILLGGLIGIISSAITIFLKYYLDSRKQKTEDKKEILAHKLMSEELTKNIPEHHPLHDLIRIKEKLKIELKKTDEINNETIELVRLFIDMNDKILNWTDRELSQIEKLSRIKQKQQSK